ncbi:hypothetical protein M501DRAFT_22606 [Patellaria atrata CBS 101060]|uniref:CWH43-like N-terminal domain-containing protein n=1 Tax=Patellaria atrata CBS 101060 TaxID=1346257 RepID=A0A9P4VUR8_9PEZI|nr:hypothetical protein M501DRAFT_22606 [Patellaria atrata CBS 101060]
MWGFSYWVFPLFAACVWLAMLLAMLLTWLIDGSPHYLSMDAKQQIAYISDIGADKLKPLFIAMGAVTVVTLDLSFIFERWLRHRGRLHPTTSNLQNALSILSILAAIAGAAGLILLTVFDSLRHGRMHNAFLGIFIGGYILSAVFTCAEYQRLGFHYREHRLLRASFWIKLAFILVEVALAIAFGVCQRQDKYNEAAVLEWIIALIFTFYILSFFIDFVPALRTKHHQSRATTVEMGMRDGAPAEFADGNGYHANGHTNGHTNGQAHGHANGAKRGRFFGGTSRNF